MMGLNNNQAEREMTRYLLGQMSEDEATNFEIRYLADDSLFEQMMLVRQDLIDGYVRHHLDATTREQFERRILSTPEEQKDVAFASALREKLNELQPAIVAKEKRSSRLAELFGAWSMPEFGLAAATLVLIAVGFGWLITENRKLQRELTIAQRERSETTTRNEQLQQQIAQLAQLNTPTPTPTPVLVTPPKLNLPIKSPDALIVYLHSDDRSGSPDTGDNTNSENTIKLPNDERSLSVEIKLLFTPVEMRCNVSLRTPDGIKIERRNLKAGSKPDGGIYVRANFGTGLLTHGEYDVTVTSVAAHNNKPITVHRQFSLKASSKP